MNLNNVLMNKAEAPGHEELPWIPAGMIYPQAAPWRLGSGDGKQESCVLPDSGWNIPNILPTWCWDGSEHAGGTEGDLRSFSTPSHTNIPVLMQIIPVLVPWSQNPP